MNEVVDTLMMMFGCDNTENSGQGTARIIDGMCHREKCQVKRDRDLAALPRLFRQSLYRLKE